MGGFSSRLSAPRGPLHDGLIPISGACIPRAIYRQERIPEPDGWPLHISTRNPVPSPHPSRDRQSVVAPPIPHPLRRTYRALRPPPRKAQNNRAARAARLPHTVIERLRWKKIKRIPADIADTIREAVERHNEESLARARHQLAIAERSNGALVARLMEIDPDFYGPDIDRLRRVFGDGRQEAGRSGGE